MAEPHTQFTTIPEGGIKPLLPPWTLKAQAWFIPIWYSKGSAQCLPETLIYPPLERPCYSDASDSGEFVGGMGTIQLLRYTSSPVGPYDELILIPGYWTWTEEKQDKDGKVHKRTRKNLRVSRIYVSQKYTCWNGRRNWSIPKHLADFRWTDNPDGSMTVKVFPYDLHPSTDPTESKPSEIPFFVTTIKPVPFVPSFPMSTSLASWVGMDISLVQPPVPEGRGSQGELVGTERWAKIFPLEKSWKTSAVWFDMKQEENGDCGVEGMQGRSENFLPGLGRWILGIRMDDATIGFGEGTYWPRPKI